MLPTALDHDLADGFDPGPTPAHSLRAARLGARGVRALLARGRERTVEAAAEPPTTFSAAAPLRRAAILDAAAELQILATLMREVDHASPAGVARARLLLIEGTGPLYSDTGEPDAIRRAARAAADAL
jgi:hypothetical protein